MPGSLRGLLGGSGVALAAGAHDALSAKLAEEAGFDAIWASGFGISAVQALPDANILTLTETLDAVRRICDAVTIPVVADCDNGYGNAINVIRTASEFERAGAAGICIEDNEFPKRCSFYAGVRRDLVAAEEHARKVEAACSARRVARLRRDRAHRGADRRAGARRGDAARSRLCRGRRRRRPGALEGARLRRAQAVQRRLDAAGAAGGRAHHVSERRPRRAGGRGIPPGDLREPAVARRHRRHAGHAPPHARDRPRRQRRRPHRAARRGLPAGRRARAEGQRAPLPVYRRGPAEGDHPGGRASSRSSCR